MEPSRLTKLAAIVIAALASVAPVAAQSPAFTEFRFMSESIGWEDDFAGVIDDNARTVTFTTQKWVENIAELSAVFELNGDYGIKVGGILQENGVTKNDFRRDVTYNINDEVDYTIKFVSPQASGLPVVKIDTKDGAPILNKVDYVNMTFALTDLDNPNNDITVINNTDGIRGRGNSSWDYAKKPYRIKFDKKQSLFGLPAAKSWVLLAEHNDITLIMNMVTFEVGNVLSLPYNHTYHHVQLYLNGVYRGVYGLTEQNQVNEGRVDIDEKHGWFIEMDSYYDEEPKFRTTSYNLPIIIKSPEVEPADIGNSAYDFVRKDINELCDSMASVNFPENGYRDLINMNTFIDFLLANEVVRNNEISGPKSTYSYKDDGGKISMGPLWDFDWAFSKSGSRYFQGFTGGGARHSFFERLFEDPVFLVKYKERWNEKYSEILAISEFIDDMGAKLEKAAAENFKIWHTYNNYAQQIADMKTWWNNRCAWLKDIGYSYLSSAFMWGLPSRKTFETQLFGYPDVPAQTFTLVSYGDMTDLSATLEKANSSDFEISAELVKTSTGKGGYLATIDIKPKNSLPVGTYSDRLVFSGSNQGKAFSLNVPLTFVVNEGETPAEVVFPVFSETIVYSPTRTLSDIELSGSGDGKFVWEDSAIVPSVNGGAYNVIFIPNDVVTYNYHAIPLKRLVELTVEKADPHYELPTGLTATYGDALESVILPDGWAWETDTDVVGSVGQQTHKAVFIPFDPDNYNIIEGIDLTVTVLTKSSVLTPDRVIPQSKPNEEATVIAPLTILAGEFTAGPNPISKQSSIVNFYRQGKRAAACELRIYDATGNIINKVKISDKALGTQARRQVGTWDLTDKKGRPVSEGTYLVKGVIKTSDGKNEKISLILGVR